MKANVSVLHGVFLLSCVSAPFLCFADTMVEVVGGLKWTYSIRENAARVVGVSLEQGGSVEGKVDIPQSFKAGRYVVTELGNGAFADLEHLSDIKIPSTVREIGQSCFKGCKRLVEVDIPPSVRVDKSAFQDCPGRH